MMLTQSGTGFGSRALPGISNILRVLLFEDAAATRMDDRIGIVRFEIDDQSPEELALGLDSIRAQEGVLDVLQMPAFGKKGRMALQIQVLCNLAALDDVIESCFRQTSTIGLRWNTVARAKLTRQMAVVDTDDSQAVVKLVKRPDNRVSAKVEAEDLRSLGSHEERREARLSAEQQAIQKRSPDK
jgi:uncharacterized protein (DUF111 family)